MEKALQGTHKVSFETYRQDHEVRMSVERRREKNYIQGLRLVHDIDRKNFYRVI